MIGQTVSHYRVASKLGAGGMGVVYEAEDTRLGRRVALKFLPEDLEHDAQSLERFQREARTASALNHPNICTVYAIDEHETPALHRHGVARRPDPGAADRAPEPIELGLILLDARHPDHGRARVGARQGDRSPRHQAGQHLRERKRPGQGPGLWPGQDRRGARPAPEDSGMVTMARVDDLTKAGSTMGTVSYMSPEQARGQLTDARTDLFSLGAVIYQMGTGNPPVPGRHLGGYLRGDPEPRAGGGEPDQSPAPRGV